MSKSFKKEARYISRVIAHVPGADALVEMMRYDRCVPESEEESHKVIRMMNGSATADDHVVSLIRYAPSDVGPSEGRWRSFGCTVLCVQHPEDAAPTREQLAAVKTYFAAGGD